MDDLEDLAYMADHASRHGEHQPCEICIQKNARIADFESGRVYQELQARIAELKEHYDRRGRVVDELEEQVERLREDVKSCHVVIKERDYFKKQNDMLWDRLREEA